jgi:hypothetical protein
VSNCEFLLQQPLFPYGGDRYMAPVIGLLNAFLLLFKHYKKNGPFSGWFLTSLTAA